MSGVPTPPLIVEPFGINAGGPYIQNPIPPTTVTPGRASFDQGFPPVTMQEKIAGGIPPFGQDVNGILYMVTAHIAALNAGQPYLYSGAMSTAIGGYAKGTILGMADGTGLWINQTAGNTSDPDASGAGWLPMYRYGYEPITGLTGGVATLTALQARSQVLVLSGVLVSNLQVVLPGTFQRWLIVNQTTGAFTTTVKTAAGTGVVVPQGGYAQPVEVYGDSTNIYPTVAPLSIPTSVAAVADTYVLRDNLGNIYATQLNQNSAPENPTIGAVPVQSDGMDGFMRWMTLANFRSQLYQVGPGQVVGMPGRANIPGGFFFQFGVFTAAANGATFVPYATAYGSMSVALCSGAYAHTDAQDNAPGVTSCTPTGFTVFNANDNPITTFYIAVGI